MVQAGKHRVIAKTKSYLQAAETESGGVGALPQGRRSGDSSVKPREQLGFLPGGRQSPRDKLRLELPNLLTKLTVRGKRQLKWQSPFGEAVGGGALAWAAGHCVVWALFPTCPAHLQAAERSFDLHVVAL